MDRRIRTLRLAIMRGKPIDDLVQGDDDKVLAVRLLYDLRSDKAQKYKKFLEDITPAQRLPLAIQARDWETVIALDHLLPEHLELLEGELQKAINSGRQQSDNPRLHELVVLVAARRSNWNVVQSLRIRKEESQRILSKLANRCPDRLERLRLLRGAVLADMCSPDGRALVEDLVALFYENPEENLKCLKRLDPRHVAGLPESASAVLVDIFKRLEVLPPQAQGSLAEQFVRFVCKVINSLEDSSIGIKVLGSLWEYVSPGYGASLPILIEAAYERCSREREPDASDVFRNLGEGRATADLLGRAVLAKDYTMASWLIRRHSFLDDTELRHLDAWHSQPSLTGIMRAGILSGRDIDDFMRHVWRADDSSHSSVRQILRDPDQQGLDRDLQARLYSSLFKLRNDRKIAGLQKLLEWGWNLQFLIDFAIRQDEDRPVCFLLDRLWQSRLELFNWFGVAVKERSYRVAVCLLANIVRLSAASRPKVPKLASPESPSGPIAKLPAEMIRHIFDYLTAEEVWLASATSQRMLFVGVDYLLTRSTIVQGIYDSPCHDFPEDEELFRNIADSEGLHFISLDHLARRQGVMSLGSGFFLIAGTNANYVSFPQALDRAAFQSIQHDQALFKQIEDDDGLDLTRLDSRQWLHIANSHSIYLIPRRILTFEGDSVTCNSRELLCSSLSGVVWLAETVCDILHALDELDSKNIRGAVQRLLYDLCTTSAVLSGNEDTIRVMVSETFSTTSDVLSGNEDTIRVMASETFSTTIQPAVHDSPWPEPFAIEQSLSSLLLQKLIETRIDSPSISIDPRQEHRQKCLLWRVLSMFYLRCQAELLQKAGKRKVKVSGKQGFV